MAQPSNETLRVFEMFEQEHPENEDVILHYINANHDNIDANYNHRRRTILAEALYLSYMHVVKRVIELGAMFDSKTIRFLIDYVKFSPPLAEAKEIMIAILGAGVSREQMLHALCFVINTTHKELLPELFQQPSVWRNGTIPIRVNEKYADQTALHNLVAAYDDNESNREIFMEMLEFLLKKGANPLETNDENQTVIELVNATLNEDDAKPIIELLKSYAPTDYKELWKEEIDEDEPDIAKLEEYKTKGNLNVDEVYKKEYGHGSFYPYTAMSVLIHKELTDKNIESIKKLLSWGADPNKMLDANVTYLDILGLPLAEANILLPLFIEKGADMNAVHHNENCIMYLLNNHSEVFSYPSGAALLKRTLEFLISNGADINYVGEYGKTALYDMLVQYNNDIADYLMQKGASVYLNGSDGKTIAYTIIKNILINNELGYNETYDTVAHMLNYLIKAKPVINDYFRDFLDAGLDTDFHKMNQVYPTYQQVFTLLTNHNLDVNKIYDDGTTPLIKAVILYDAINNPDAIYMIQTLLTKGANPQYVDASGKKAVDYTNDEEIKELLEPADSTKFKKLWPGFSKADVDFTNMIFHQTMNANNLAIANPDESLFSFCPVCLKYIQHATGSCMYMTHSCIEQAGYEGYYHKKLWDAFSYEKQYDNLGNRIPPGQRKRVIEWCTLCGRICNGHQHYDLSPIYVPGTKKIGIPEFVGNGGDYFATTCDKPSIGGGGIKEKMNRYRQFR